MATAKKRTSFLGGPFIWILLALLVLIPVLSTLTSGGGSRVDTNVGLELLQDDKATEAKIYDGEQKVELTLADDYSADGRDYGRNVEFFYVEPRGEQIVQAMKTGMMEMKTAKTTAVVTAGVVLGMTLAAGAAPASAGVKTKTPVVVVVDGGTLNGGTLNGGTLN